MGTLFSAVWLAAVIGAALGGLGTLTLLFKKESGYTVGEIVRWTLINTVIGALVTWLIAGCLEYLTIAPLNGVYDGTLAVQWEAAIGFLGALIVMLIVADIWGGERNEYRGDAADWLGESEAAAPARSAFGLWALELVLILVILTYGVLYLIDVPGNYQALARIGYVRQMAATDTMPAVDPTHLPIVTRGMALYKGQQAIAADGHNYGSQYQTNSDQYTLQSVKGHLYWIAPLEYANAWNNLFDYSTPGYVWVDAENPDAAGHLVDTYSFHYTPDGYFGKRLDRYLDEHGYLSCTLLDPTLEIDDSGAGPTPDGRPYYTVGCAHPALTFAGDTLTSVLVVNASTGAIRQYAVQDAPAWIDRIYGAGTIKEYLTWWGWYAHGGGYINWTGATQQQPTDADSPQILYAAGSHETVFVEPMTSSNGNDQSSTGVMLCYTRHNECDNYPLLGYGVGSDVTTTFASAQANLQHYDVSTPQLLNLYDNPTWLATYTRNAGTGDQFAAVGLVDATPGNLQASNVIFAPTLSQALSAYQQYLAGKANGNGYHPTGVGQSVQVTGVVVGVTSQTTNGQTTYLVLVKGHAQVFRVSASDYAYIAFARAGDTVHLSYLATQQQTVDVTQFDDTTLDAQLRAS